MVDAAHFACSDFGIPQDQVFLEKFLPSGPCGDACDPNTVHSLHQPATA